MYLGRFLRSDCLCSQDKAYDMQRIALPARGMTCLHPRTFDIKTHTKAMISKDRSKVWEQACTMLIHDFVESLTAKRTEPKRIIDAQGMLKDAFTRLPTPSGNTMPPGVEMLSGDAPEFLSAIRECNQTDAYQAMMQAFGEFWNGPRGMRWRDLYKAGPNTWLMGKWGCPFCPGQANKACAGWAQLMIDESLEQLISEAVGKCGEDGARSVDVRCCGVSEAEDAGPRSGAVPLLVSGQAGGLLLNWSAEQDSSGEEEEVDLT